MTLPPIHPEAFCLMTYVRQPLNPTQAIGPAGAPDPKAPEQLLIWNSRDGVTPFVLFRDGYEYRAEGLRARALRFEPALGSLIWVTMTLKDARAEALGETEYQWYTELVAQRGLAFSEAYPTFAHWATYRMIELYGQGTMPRLHVVDEQWLVLHGEKQFSSSGPSWMRSGRHG